MTKQQALKLLGLSNNSTKSEIKKAFHKKALQFHPDRNPNGHTQQQFVAVVEAYEILIKKKKSTITFDNTGNSYNKTSNTQKTHFHFRNKHHVHRNYSEHISKEEFEARYQYAKEKYEEYLNRKSQKIYDENYSDYINSNKRKFAKIMAATGILLIILFSLDHYVLPHRLYKINLNKTKFKYEYRTGNETFYSFKFLHQRIFISDNFFQNNYNINTSTIITTTHIFKDVLEVKRISKNKKYQVKIAELNTSLHFHFMLIMLLLFIPTITFWVERPTFNFIFFGVYYNLYIFPFLVAFLLLNDLRILRIFEGV